MRHGVSAALMALLLCGVALAVGACRSKPGQVDPDRVVADTGGYALRLVVKRPKELKFELYEVTRKGRAGFCGGEAARDERQPTFMTELPPDVAESFRQELARCPWTEAKPEDRGPEGTEPVTVVTLGLPNGIDRKFTLFGPQPQVDVFVRLLEPVVRKRHDPFLDRLPEATEPPRPKPEPAPVTNPATKPAG